jgi:DNA mismatch endonuclease, patch repair protein
VPDVFTREKRSWVMSRIRSKNTRGELALRHALTQAGVRGYRVNDRRLPGKPDLVFGRSRLVVFVDGGYWHGHPRFFTAGKSGAYWDEKIAGNVRRDLRVRRRIRAAGWRVMRLWDFRVLSDPGHAAARVARRLAAVRE